MESQITYLKAALLLISWQLVWTRMAQKAKKLILMNVIHDACHILFVYHPIMWHILRLATMEVKHESTCEINLFWELFNEILSDTKGRAYKFNSKAIMVDENSANYCVMQKVLGVNFITSKVVGCQITTRMMSIGCP